MLAVDQRMVRPGAARPGPPEDSGVSGDPSRASAELGQLGVDLIVSRTVEAIKKAVARR
jgi:creatinine amidohydrolase/Fe(II)-dependent formamide hydrolase-like protein